MTWNRLTLISKISTDKYLFKCECGNEKIARLKDVKSGKTKSCGCLMKEKSTKTLKEKVNKHSFNISNTRINKIYTGIVKRCYNKNFKFYNYYGGKGIKVADEWLGDYGRLNFYIWACNNGYNDNSTIDRINPNNDYSPQNCRWVDMKKQNNNKTNNRLLTYNNQTLTISQWSEELNIKREALADRIYRNWSVEKALTTPLRIRKEIK